MKEGRNPILILSSTSNREQMDGPRQWNSRPKFLRAVGCCEAEKARWVGREKHSGGQRWRMRKFKDGEGEGKQDLGNLRLDLLVLPGSQNLVGKSHTGGKCGR